MTTVLLVHGTGVRAERYEAMFTEVGCQISKVGPDVVLDRCFWGGPHGAVLALNGASVPTYADTRAIGEPYDDIELWGLLWDDPLAELRLLSLGDRARMAVPGRIPPGRQVDERMRALSRDPHLRELLEGASLMEPFAWARGRVVAADEYRDAIVHADAVPELAVALARSLAVWTLQRAEMSEARVPVSAQVRDRLVEAVVAALGGQERGVGRGAARVLGEMAMRCGGTRYLRRHRGAVTDAVSPLAGDVLLYQARGEAIRGAISSRIRASPRPVVVLAHSLGGVAAVDLLADEAHPEVELLVTVGSQAPFLYEIDALYSMRRDGNGLPPHFPKWLNFYDLRDVLSYVGRDVFGPRVRDVELDTGYPFPRAHSAYWSCEAMWKEMATALP